MIRFTIYIKQRWWKDLLLLYLPSVSIYSMLKSSGAIIPRLEYGWFCLFGIFALLWCIMNVRFKEKA